MVSIVVVRMWNVRDTDIDSDKVDLGVTVLASFRGGHVDDLARTTF